MTVEEEVKVEVEADAEAETEIAANVVVEENTPTPEETVEEGIDFVTLGMFIIGKTSTGPLSASSLT